MDRGDWQAPVHGITKGQTRLNDCIMLILRNPDESMFGHSKNVRVKL